jgi:hypothetical protein
VGTAASEGNGSIATEPVSVDAGELVGGGGAGALLGLALPLFARAAIAAKDMGGWWGWKTVAGGLVVTGMATAAAFSGCSTREEETLSALVASD